MRGIREFYEEPQFIFNRIMENGEIQIISFGCDYIKGDKLLDDIENKKYPAYLAEQLIECRILGDPFVSSLFE